MNDFPIEQKKKFFFILVIVCLLINGWWCYRDANRSLEQGIHLNVNSRAGTGLSTYSRHILHDGRGYYLTGTQGDLYWQPNTLVEAVLLNTIGSNTTDVLNVAAVLIISCVIMYTFKGSRQGAIFTKNMSNGFPLVMGLLVIMEIFCALLRHKIGYQYLAYVTHNRFTAVVNYKFGFGDFILPILMFLANIPAKGLEQQKEAELTI